MENDKTAELLTHIGELLDEDKEYPIDGTLLYAQLEQGCVGPYIFKNRGNHIVSRWPDLNHLGNALLDLWYLQQGPDRWAEIEYLIDKGRFHVVYVYPDEIDPEENRWDRHQKTMRRYFGDKPIIQPPWPPPDADVPEYEL